MITIHGELYSKKNSKEIYKRKSKTGKTTLFIGSNANVKMNESQIMHQLYKAENITMWKQITNGKQYPLSVKFYIYRSTARAFDYVNIIQVLLDCMVKASYLPDDDMNHLIPIFEGWEKDKENPRVEFWL